ncbi:MAG: TonB family protein [Lacibacter sp.]
MTTNQLLNADLLDIIFENRNKEYGAYVLRREYPQNLKKAIVFMLIIVAGVIIYAFATPKVNRISELGNERIREVEFIKVDEPEKPKPEEQRTVKDKPATKIDKVPVIVDKDSVEHPVPDRSEPEEYVPGDEDSPATGNGQGMVQGQEGDETAITPKPAEPEAPAIIEAGEADVQPEFPGGTEAWRNYLSRMLRMPEELEEGQRKTVRIRFIVNVNGEITDAAVVQSAGAIFDREVLRVIGKMPKWKPGKQKGKNIAVYFTQPVTFVAEAE